MGLAVTGSSHERQYCITNESLGLNKAEKSVPWETFTHLGRDTHPDGRETGLVNVVIPFNWRDLWEDVLESHIFIYIMTFSLHTFSELPEV